MSTDQISVDLSNPCHPSAIPEILSFLIAR